MLDLSEIFDRAENDWGIEQAKTAYVQDRLDLSELEEAIGQRLDEIATSDEPKELAELIDLDVRRELVRKGYALLGEAKKEAKHLRRVEDRRETALKAGQNAKERGWQPPAQ